MAKIVVTGVDVGRRNTGVVSYDMIAKKVIQNGTIDLSLADTRKTRLYNPIYYRLDLARSILTAILDDVDPVLVVVEDYIYGTKPVTPQDVEGMDRDALKLAEMHGSLCAAIAGQDRPILKVSPTQMKLFMTGDGTADKRKMIKRVYEAFKVSMPDEHQYDALCAANIGRYFISYCINPSGKVFNNSYVAHTCNRLMFDRRFEGVGDEVRARVSAISEVTAEG